MATIRLTIRGDKETADVLRKLSNEFKDFSVPLDNSSKKYLNVISSNFKDEGNTFGRPWPPLSRATIEIKRKLRAVGKSIGVTKPLLRTGLLRRSFGFELKGKNQSNIYNATDYALIHQEGGTVFFKGKERKVPRRILADIDDRRIQSVGMTFERWVYDLIRKYKAE